MGSVLKYSFWHNLDLSRAFILPYSQTPLYVIFLCFVHFSYILCCEVTFQGFRALKDWPEDYELILKTRQCLKANLFLKSMSARFN